MNLDPYLNRKQPFSTSVIWEWQEKAYEALGPRAWTTGGVPSYLTSCPLAAAHFAALTAAYLRDLGDIDPSKPVWIVDLGAGSGRFAYLFLQKLRELLPNPPCPIRYLLTDISDETIESWKSHKGLQTFSDQLEFASFYHRDPFPLQTENPFILIANYFFDTIPQALYRIENGQLLEGFLTLKGEASDSLDTIKEHYSYEPTSLADIPDPSRSILQGYLDEGQDVTFLFPSEALSLLARFQEKKHLLLACDQGIAFEDEWKQGLLPVLHKHGTFSVPVNYDALRRFYRRGWLYSAKEEPSFVIGAFAEEADLDAPWRQTIGHFSVRDYWQLVEALPQKLSLSTMFALLQLGEGDPHNFYFWYGEIRRQLLLATEREKRAWEPLLNRIGGHAFPIDDEKGDFFQNLGVLFFEMGNVKQALYWFEEAILWSGLTPDLEKNILACQTTMGKS